MKYLKSFKESILNDVRSSVNSTRADIKSSLSGAHKFCHNCGTKLEMTSTFCGECGEKQDGEEKSNSFTIEGTLEKEFAGKEYSRSKTPVLVLRSDNKTLNGTKVSLKGFDWMSISKKIGVPVKITGTTENGEAPKFNNPIVVASANDIK
jgi:hypothetical protein